MFRRSQQYPTVYIMRNRKFIKQNNVEITAWNRWMQPEKRTPRVESSDHWYYQETSPASSSFQLIAFSNRRQMTIHFIVRNAPKETKFQIQNKGVQRVELKKVNWNADTDDEGRIWFHRFTNRNWNIGSWGLPKLVSALIEKTLRHWARKMRWILKAHEKLYLSA